MPSTIVQISDHFTKRGAQKKADYYNAGRNPGPYSVVRRDGLREWQVQFDRDFHAEKAKHFHG